MLKQLRNFYYPTLCTHSGYNGVCLIRQYVVSQHTKPVFNEFDMR
jgi:hypothetical protein